jgi:hypothetical protein
MKKSSFPKTKSKFVLSIIDIQYISLLPKQGPSQYAPKRQGSPEKNRDSPIQSRRPSDYLKEEKKEKKKEKTPTIRELCTTTTICLLG